MNKIRICASKAYDVCIGSGLLAEIGQIVSQYIPGRKIAIVSDSNVWPLYGELVEKSLENAGYTPVSFTFPAGEASKNGETYLSVLQFLAKKELTRADSILALGGGVVGDLSGFAAATYLRGIRYIQVPTTLLAAVDSSVGGKTAIDLPAGKNLVGAFHQPSLVICDTDCLNSLPADVFQDGCAEVIKYGILYDPELFDHLMENGLQFDRERVITKCVEWKRNVVIQDEFDTGSRMLLNFGHTFGHSIELMSNYRVSHGRAVAIGMSMAARAAAHLHACSEATRNSILDILKLFSLPTETEYYPSNLARAALMDKKRSDITLSFILPKKIGGCSIYPVAIDDIPVLMKMGLTK